MRAYYTLMKDSFREALASRVLWILLFGITLLLSVLAGLHTVEMTASHLQRTDLRDGRGLLQALKADGLAQRQTPAAHVWSQLTEPTRSRIQELDDQSEGRKYLGAISNVRDELNALLQTDQLYDKQAWKSVVLGDESRELLQQGFEQLSVDQRARVQRLALDAAFPDYLAPCRNASLGLNWFAWSINSELPIPPDRVAETVDQILAGLMVWFAGFFGVFIAILVTAPLIPRTFNAGEIDLLLSKPVARPLLFLTKFLGGCTFIVLNAAYFILGLWLIVGIQFGIWNGRLLLCIPVFLFVFSVYYAVSAYAGLVWRNAIVSVILTLIFWGGCFSVGLAKTVIDSILNPQRIARIIPAGDTLLITTKPGTTSEWKVDERHWEQVFDAQDSNGPPQIEFGFRYPLIGPVYDDNSQRIVAIRIPGFGFRRFNAGGTLTVGRRADDWRATAGTPTPSGTTDLFIDPEGEIVTVGRRGVFRMEGTPGTEKRPFVIAGFDLAKLATPEAQPVFVKAQPERQANWNDAQHFQATMRPQDGQLAVYHDGQLTQLQLNEQRLYVAQDTRELASDDAALLGYTDSHLIAALASGEILLVTLQPFKTTARFRPFKQNKPKYVTTSPDGRWVTVLFHHRHLWLYDIESAKVAHHISGQGDISAVAFTANQSIMISTGFGEVQEYSLPDLSPKEHFRPQPETLETVYRYAILPLYTLFPKPGELDNLVRYLLTNEESVEINSNDNNLQNERVVLDIWQPIWSNLGFVICMLTLSCVRVWRRDF